MFGQAAEIISHLSEDNLRFKCKNLNGAENEMTEKHLGLETEKSIDDPVASVQVLSLQPFLHED